MPIIEPDYPFYRCLDCGEEFVDPDHRKEHENHPEVEGPYREEWEVPLCPECGSEYIEGGYRCQWCDYNWASIDYCEECIGELTDLVTNYGRRLGHNYQDTLDFVEAFVRRHW